MRWVKKASADFGFRELLLLLLQKAFAQHSTPH
jgi:hypothetical protein